jgi:hypothetical protein
MKKRVNVSILFIVFLFTSFLNLDITNSFDNIKAIPESTIVDGESFPTIDDHKKHEGHLNEEFLLPIVLFFITASCSYYIYFLKKRKMLIPVMYQSKYVIVPL